MNKQLHQSLVGPAISVLLPARVSAEAVSPRGIAVAPSLAVAMFA